MKLGITGGHFSPAYALISEGKVLNAVVFGRKNTFERDNADSFEYETCKKYGIAFEQVRAARLNRSLNFLSVISLLKFPLGVLDASIALKKHRVEILLSFGGYIGFTTSVAAWILRIPIIVHEQTQEAGMANKIISLFAKRICISFESSRRFFPKSRTIFTGNPIRKEVFVLGKPLFSTSREILYITGGSGGSSAINAMVFDSLEKLLEKFTILHQTGNSKLTQDFEKAKSIQKALDRDKSKNYIVKEFVGHEEIGWVLKNASMVVSRSGINTVIELMALEKISLLIPLPHGQGDEQVKNANLLKSVGLARVIEQKDLASSEFADAIFDIFKNREAFSISKKDKDLYVKKDAANSLFSQVKLVYEKNCKKKN